MVIFDFSDPASADVFHAIDDRVMGGVSTSGLHAGSGYAVFEGDVSMENRGGFASVRSSRGDWDLSGWSGLELEVRGDGKTYKLSVTTDSRIDSVVYRAPFTVGGNGWMKVRIPFADFVPTFRGETVEDAGPLDPSSIDSFGFLISDGQEGPFGLMIQAIRAY